MAAPEKKLGEYLLQLVMSSDLRGRFEKDPKKMLKTSGLNPSKQAILLGGNLTQILHELAAEYGPTPGDHLV